MRKLITIIIITVLITSCKKNDVESSENSDTTTENRSEKPIENSIKAAEINWNEMPDLQDIGDFPFITAPKGLTMDNEKNGLSDFFPFEEMLNNTGNGIYTTEGKLGIIHFSDRDYNQLFFNKSVLSYFDELGAKKINSGVIPEIDSIRTKYSKTIYDGKHRMFGMSPYNDPISLYAFKNKGKNYVVNVQSNSAQGEIYIMELEAFKQTITKYTSKEMLDDINVKGKAILNINFDTDKATLQPDGQTIVNEIFELLSNNPKLNLSIEGHTDTTGSANRNKQLSADRANTVMYALAGKGIDIKRLKANGYGSDKPLVANDTEDNKSKNRRVELIKF